MEELLKYLDNKISMYEKDENAYSFTIFCELMSIKLALNKIKNTITDLDFDKYSTIFLASIPEQIKRLKENELCRSGWDNIKLDYSFEKIEENLNCINMISGDDLDDDLKSIINHLADIANYANMAILKCQKIIDGEAEYDYEGDE
jgi:hypothetical protein